jgi:6-phosphogluconolactonase
MSGPVIECRLGARLPWRQALVAAVTEGLAAATARRRRPVLALSGGQTPRAYLPALVRAPLPWSAVTVTLADDRLVPRAHAASNLGLLTRAFQIRRPASRPTMIPLTAAVVPPPDVVVLGMGEDGHTASLFPDCPRRPGRSPLTETVRQPGDPYRRVTLSQDALAAAPLVILMLAGPAKLRLWTAIRDKRGPSRHLPVARVLAARTAPTLVLLLDET